MNLIKAISLSSLSFYLLVSTSCNKVFFADRSTVLKREQGYIFEQRNQMLFIPMDTDKDFFSQINGKTGYRIYQYPGYEGPKYAQGDSILVEMHYYDSQTKQDVLFNEKIYLVRAAIVYTDDRKSLSSEKAGIEFDYSGKTYSFTAYARRYTQVYQVVGVISPLDGK